MSLTECILQQAAILGFDWEPDDSIPSDSSRWAATYTGRSFEFEIHGRRGSTHGGIDDADTSILVRELPDGDWKCTPVRDVYSRIYSGKFRRSAASAARHIAGHAALQARI